jgi:hypothetical protein
MIIRDRSYPCRCRFCGARRRISMHPTRLIRIPRCHCRGEKKALRKAYREGKSPPQTWRVDLYRDSRREHPKKRVCQCENYGFPHRRGSGWCVNNPHWTAEEAERREAWA